MSDQGNQNPRQERTDFYNALFCGFFALLLFLLPWYFSFDRLPYPLLGSIFSIVFYLAGLFFLIFAFTFANSGIKKNPELRALLPSFMGSEDGWQGLFGAATFLAIAAVTHWVAIIVFEAVGVAAVFVKFFVYFVLLLAFSQVAQAFDGFVVRPLIHSASRGDAEREAFAKRVRQVGIILGATLGILASIATVYDVTLR